jgi:hypothetical protein
VRTLGVACFPTALSISINRRSNVAASISGAPSCLDEAYSPENCPTGCDLNHSISRKNPKPLNASLTPTQ